MPALHPLQLVASVVWLSRVPTLERVTGRLSRAATLDGNPTQ